VSNVAGRVGSASARGFQADFLVHVWPTRYHSDSRTNVQLYLQQLFTETPSHTQRLFAFAFVSDHRRHDLCPAFCPLWLISKVLD